jgi:hypothetical protein
MVRNLPPEERRRLDDALNQRPGEPAGPPSWWKGEEDAAKTAQQFMSFVRTNG